MNIQVATSASSILVCCIPPAFTYRARRRLFFFERFPFFSLALLFHLTVSTLRSRFISLPKLSPSSSQGTVLTLLPVPEQVDDEEQAKELDGEAGDKDRQSPNESDGSASASLNLASKPRHPEGGLAAAKSASQPLPAELAPSTNKHLG